MESLTDKELRRALVSNGVDAGPITDSTRKVYLDKLAKIMGVTVQPTTLTPTKSCTQQQNSTVTSIYGNAAPCLNVIQELWKSFDNPEHISTDTVIIFDDSQTCYVNRGLIVAVNETLTSLFYNLEQPFFINVVTLTGSSMSVCVRPNETGIDLKEKISLLHGIPINQLRLIFNQTEIENDVSLNQYELTSGSSVNLCLISQPILPSPYPLMCTIQNMNTLLSIAHLRLNYNLSNVMTLHNPSMPQSTPHVKLQSNIQHILHVNNIPSTEFKLFMGFLYSGHMPTFNAPQVSLSFAVCAILGKIFGSDVFVSASLHHLKIALQEDITHKSTLLKISKDINFPCLMETVMSIENC